MIVVVTSIELKSPFKFFALSSRALKVVRQLKNTPCVQKKTQGFWTKHYTMTMWNNVEDMREFASSGAHQQVMKDSAQIAKEIRTTRVERDALPSWKEAKQLLKEAKVYTYN